MATHHSPVPSERDRVEVQRSAEEARIFGFVPLEHSQVDRYLYPPANSPFGIEHAFHLLGEIRGKTVLDLGCGQGENLIPLAKRGAAAIGIDISPDLIGLAHQRIRAAGVSAELAIRSAYETGLPDDSIDIIFCKALIHHLDVRKVRTEMLRILKPSGFIVLSEPVRFSKLYDRSRKLLKPRSNISSFEHPLTWHEVEDFLDGFLVEQIRFFRLPFVQLTGKFLPNSQRRGHNLSAWLLDEFPPLRHFATAVVMKLRKNVQLEPPRDS
jgi:SAM-dependent methyltransferase